MVGCITNSMDMSLSKPWDLVKNREAWCAIVHGLAKSWTWQSNWTTIPTMLHHSAAQAQATVAQQHNHKPSSDGVPEIPCTSQRTPASLHLFLRKLKISQVVASLEISHNHNRTSITQSQCAAHKYQCCFVPSIPNVAAAFYSTNMGLTLVFPSCCFSLFQSVSVWWYKICHNFLNTTLFKKWTLIHLPLTVGWTLLVVSGDEQDMTEMMLCG